MAGDQIAGNDAMFDNGIFSDDNNCNSEKNDTQNSWNADPPETNPIQEEGPSKLLSYRYALVMWGTLGFINLYFQRVNLSGDCKWS